MSLETYWMVAPLILLAVVGAMTAGILWFLRDRS